MPRPMNDTMLKVILAVQAKKLLAIREGILHDQDRNWIKECEQYYRAVPDEIIQRSGLRRNRLDLDRILAMKVGDDLMTALREELERFDFERY